MAPAGSGYDRDRPDRSPRTGIEILGFGIEPTPERVKAVFARAKSVDRTLTDAEIQATLGTVSGTQVS